MADIVGFRPTDAARIARAVRRFEATPQTSPQAPGSGTLGAGSNVQRLKITSSTPLGAVGTTTSRTYYPARTLRLNITTGVWDEVFAHNDAAVFDPAGGSFAVDDEVDARMVTAGTIGGTLYPVFEKITGGGDGDLELIRVTNYFCRDTGGTPSPNCHYPGQIRTLSAAGFANTTNVWLVPHQDLGHVPAIGIGAPTTTLICDGNWAYFGKYAGYSYAPDDGEHPNSGESRPVYMTSGVAFGYMIQCTPPLKLILSE